MTRATVRRHRRRAPTIVGAEPLLTILRAKDNGSCCAKCPEWDLVTALPTADAAVEELIEAIGDYAKEYLRDRDQYAASPNRAHHLPYVEAIAACKTDWALRRLIEIKPGCVHGSRFPYGEKQRGRESFIRVLRVALLRSGLLWGQENSTPPFPILFDDTPSCWLRESKGSGVLIMLSQKTTPDPCSWFDLFSWFLHRSGH